MNKRGVESVLNFVIGLFFVVVVFLLIGKFWINSSSAQQCPGGFDIVSDFSNPTIKDYCGSEDELIENNQLCCLRSRESFNQVCLWDREERRYIGDCIKLAEFNFKNVCLDNTECGKSTEKCSGAYCEKGLCLVENGIGRCVDKFELNNKEIVIDDNKLCETGLEDSTLGSKCDGKRHCILDLAESRTLCRGGFFAVSESDAFDECKNLCEKAREEFTPDEIFKSQFCEKDAFPVFVEDRDGPVMKRCVDIFPGCSCTVIGATPPEE